MWGCLPQSLGQLLPFGPLRLDLAWSRHPEFSGSEVFGRLRPFAYQVAIGPSF